MGVGEPLLFKLILWHQDENVCAIYQPNRTNKACAEFGFALQRTSRLQAAQVV